MLTCFLVDAQVRESRDVCLTAIGIDAVAIAIRAVCFARLYLQVSLLTSALKLVLQFSSDVRQAKSLSRP